MIHPWEFNFRYGFLGREFCFLVGPVSRILVNYNWNVLLEWLSEEQYLKVKISISFSQIEACLFAPYFSACCCWWLLVFSIWEGNDDKRLFKSRSDDQNTSIVRKVRDRKRWGASSWLVNLPLLVSFWANCWDQFCASFHLQKRGMAIFLFMTSFKVFSSMKRSNGGSSSMFLKSHQLGRSYNGILEMEMYWRLAGVIKYHMWLVVMEIGPVLTW